MGWTITYDTHRLKDFLKDRTEGWESKDAGVVAKKTTCVTYHYCMHNPGSGVLFKVMETTRMAPDGVTPVGSERWIGVDLIKYYGGKNKQYGWGYKDMEASMGPTAHGCPLSYVDELVPEPGPCAKTDCKGCGKCWEREWRMRVRTMHAETKKKREFLKSLKPGDVVVLGKNWTAGGEALTVSEVYPKRRKISAGGMLVPAKAIDIEASLEAVGVDKAAT
jgi:hypothetical protein